jgi:hypothetical protein
MSFRPRKPKTSYLSATEIAGIFQAERQNHDQKLMQQLEKQGLLKQQQQQTPAK